jgi:hypothetical protein
MTKPDLFTIYLDELRRTLATGVAQEHAYRRALEDLLEAVGEGVQAVNEPSHIACGAPDFILLRGGSPVEYVEANVAGGAIDAAAGPQRLAHMSRDSECGGAE